jgi:hypothetical protein
MQCGSTCIDFAFPLQLSGIPSAFADLNEKLVNGGRITCTIPGVFFNSRTHPEEDEN